MFGADVIALFGGVGLGTFGSTLFLSSKAVPAAGTVLVVIEAPGLRPQRVHNDVAPRIRRPRAQITARASQYSAAKALALQAYDVLCTVVNTTVNGRFYQAMTPEQEPFDLGTDDQGRVTVGFNVLGEAGGLV